MSIITLKNALVNARKQSNELIVFTSDQDKLNSLKESLNTAYDAALSIELQLSLVTDKDYSKSEIEKEINNMLQALD